MSRRTLIIAFALLLFAAAGVMVAAVVVGRGAAPGMTQTAAIGGPFTLTDQSGRTVDQRLLKGKWSAVFFGFTFCPDACPTTLFALGEAEKLLGAKADDFQTVFVTTDPERDTSDKVAEYLNNDAFPKHVVGLTGTPDQIQAAARAYRVYYAKRPLEGGDYTVDHSTIAYLMNPQGQLACVIRYGASPQEIATLVRGGMAKGKRAQSC